MLRRVRVCSVLSLAIVIVLGVRGAECDECACAEQAVRVPSAIDAHAAAVISKARSAIASHGAPVRSCGKLFCSH